jgi:hypothetical protein
MKRSRGESVSDAIEINDEDKCIHFVDLTASPAVKVGWFVCFFFFFIFFNQLKLSRVSDVTPADFDEIHRLTRRAEEEAAVPIELTNSFWPIHEMRNLQKNVNQRKQKFFLLYVLLC